MSHLFCIDFNQEIFMFIRFLLLIYKNYDPLGQVSAIEAMALLHCICHSRVQFILKERQIVLMDAIKTIQCIASMLRDY